MFLNHNINLNVLIAFSVLLNNICCLEIPTCCPENFQIKLFEDDIFFCDLYNNNNNINNNGIMPKLGPISGFLIRTSYKVNIPNCQDVQIYPVSNKHVDLSVNACVGIMNDDYVALSCPDFHKNAIVKVNAIKKCCPNGQSYNLNKQGCFKSSDNFNVFNKILNQPTIFKNEDLNCVNGNVVVQYFSVNSTFVFDGSDLIVDNRRFYADLYCLETVTYNMVFQQKHGYSVPPTYQSSYMARTCHRSSSICDNIPCVPRCCGGWQKYVLHENNSTTCEPHLVDMKTEFLKIVHNEDDYKALIVNPKAFGILHQEGCLDKDFQPELYDKSLQYFDYRNGNIYLPFLKQTFSRPEYCVEYIQNGKNLEIGTFLCVTVNHNVNRPPFYAYITVFSCVFLFLTFCVYIFVPNLLNLHGQILICYVASLLAAYVSLALSAFIRFEKKVCLFVAIPKYFSIIASFSWLNIICFDIWWTLSSVDRLRAVRAANDWRRFLVYSAYAWGIALLCTGITCAFNYDKMISKGFNQPTAVYSCWFEKDGLAVIIFFLLPMGLLVIINVVLFVYTLRYCNKVKNEMIRMESLDRQKLNIKKCFLANKDKIAMNGKLFVVMGITWVFEIANASLPGYERFFVVSDAIIALQGVFIFLIFVCKKSIFEGIKKRIGLGAKTVRL